MLLTAKTLLSVEDVVGVGNFLTWILLLLALLESSSPPVGRSLPPRICAQSGGEKRDGRIGRLSLSLPLLLSLNCPLFTQSGVAAAEITRTLPARRRSVRRRCGERPISHLSLSASFAHLRRCRCLPRRRSKRARRVERPMNEDHRSSASARSPIFKWTAIFPRPTPPPLSDFV